MVKYIAKQIDLMQRFVQITRSCILLRLRCRRDLWINYPSEIMGNLGLFKSICEHLFAK
jgi:hypothetical protein